MSNLTIRAKGKILLENTSMVISAGRRYGLVGPNGKGKSTLMRMLARRQIPVSEAIDVLLVEQEIVGDERWVARAWGAEAVGRVRAVRGGGCGQLVGWRDDRTMGGGLPGPVLDRGAVAGRA